MSSNKNFKSEFSSNGSGDPNNTNGPGSPILPGESIFPLSLQKILTGQDLPANYNQIRIGDQFPDFKMPSEIEVGYGDSPVYLEWTYQNSSQTGDCVPCRKGWSTVWNSGAYAPDKINMNQKWSWGPIRSYESQHNDIVNGVDPVGVGQNAWGIIKWDFNPITKQKDQLISAYSWDNEGPDGANMHYAAGFAQGIITAANADGVKPFRFDIYGSAIVKDYGNPTSLFYDGGLNSNETRVQNSLYSGSFSQYAIWPYFDRQKIYTDVASGKKYSARERATTTSMLAPLVNINLPGQIQYNLDYYISTPIPETVSMYEKENNNFKRDLTGRRVFKMNNFSEKIRNTVVTWKGEDGNGWKRDPVSGMMIIGTCPNLPQYNPGFKRVDGSTVCSFDTSNRWAGMLMPEVYYGATSLSSQYSKFIFSLIALSKTINGNEDIVNTLYNQPVEFNSTLTPLAATFITPSEPGVDKNGPNPNIAGVYSSNKIISPYQATFSAWISLALIKNYTLWSGYLPHGGPNGGGLLAPAMGSAKGYESFDVNNDLSAAIFAANGWHCPLPAGQIDPNPGLAICPADKSYQEVGSKMYTDMSVIENFTAVNYAAYLLNKNYGFFGGKDKRLAFTEPTNIQDGEILAFGRLLNNKVLLIAGEPLLDVGESMQIKLKIKNNPQFSKTLMINPNGKKQVLVDVITLPAGSYKASDIYLEYTSLPILKTKGQFFKTSGDLTQHEVL